MSNHVSTIVAEATPPGRGGVAILRVSGSLVTDLIPSLLKKTLNPREATYCSFLDEAGHAIDTGIAIYFPGPHSFTGEDVLELQGHGGPIVVDLLLKRLLNSGVKIARPGEFSERAFLNGKIDLAQAEAIADLIDASSAQAARSAMQSLQGEFSKKILALTEQLTQLRTYIEAAIDFSDEEIDFLTNDTIKLALFNLIEALQTIENNAKQGSLLREGIRVIIMGAPNVGKSSLLNCLSGKDSAIVTPIPGTTRDILKEYISIDGLPLHIIDTAGLRETDDVIEQEGIKRAHLELEEADLVLYMRDAKSSSTLELAELPQSINTRPIIIINNKIDLLQQSPEANVVEGHPVISLSVKLNEGIDLLKEKIKLLSGYQTESAGVFIARRRHLDALSRAHQHLNEVKHELTQSHQPELAAEGLRLAQKALGEITGEFHADDLLGRIFSTFCIGK